MEVWPNHVPSTCLNENVSLTSVQKHFSPNAWGVVCNVVDTIRKRPVWYCGKCTKDETETIACESRSFVRKQRVYFEAIASRQVQE